MELSITAALASARAALDIAKVALAARDDSKVREAISNMEGRLHDATSAALASAEKAFALQTALHEAQREKTDVQARLDERGHYVLHEVGPGLFCYASQPTDDAVEPAHYVCQLCFDRGTKSILRLLNSHNFGNMLNCAEDPKHVLQLGHNAPRGRRVLSPGAV